MPSYVNIILVIIGVISAIALFAGHFLTAIIGVALIGAGIFVFRGRPAKEE